MKKRLLSAILVLAMVLSLMPATVFATTGEETQYSVLDVDKNGVVNYVSLGESMTNGYGNPGYYPIYDQETHGFLHGEVIDRMGQYDENGNRQGSWYAADGTTNPFGYGRTDVVTYASLFEKYLEEEYEVEVNWEPWAISGQRPEDFYWLMQKNWKKGMDAGKDGATVAISDYSGDQYSYDETGLVSYFKDGSQWYQTTQDQPLFEEDGTYNGDMYTTAIWKNGNNNEAQVSRFLAAYYGRFGNAVEGNGPDGQGSLERAGEGSLAWKHPSYWKNYYNATDRIEQYLADFRDEYTLALKEADVITVNLGTHCFSANVSSQIHETLAADTQQYLYEDHLRNDPMEVIKGLPADQQASYKKIYESIMKIIDENMASVITELGAEYTDDIKAKLDKIQNIYGYATMSFIVTYDLSLQRIREINPNAQIVILGMSNFQEGITFDMGEGKADVSFGDLFGAIVDFTNLYRAAWVEDSKDCIYVPPVENMDLLIDELARGETNPIFLIKMMMSFGTSYDFGHDEVNEYLNQWSDNKWTRQPWAAEYISTGKYPAAVENSEYDKQMLDKVKDVYEGVREIAATETFNGDDALAMVTDKLDMKDAVSLIATPDEMNGAQKAAAHFWIRCFMGEGVGCHPSETGHKQVFEVLKANWENGFTGSSYVEQQKPALLEKLELIIASDKIDDAKKVELISELYGMLKDKDVLKDDEKKMLNTLGKIYDYLKPNGYITDEQSVEILIEIFAAMKDDSKIDDDEKLNLVKVCVEVLGKNENLTDTDRVAMIGNIYTILEEDGFLENYDAEKLTLINKIYDVLDPVMDDTQTVNVAKYLYNNMLVDGEEELDVLAAMDFIIEALGKSEPAMTSKQKVDTIGKVYTILAEDTDYLDEYAEKLALVEDIYAVLDPVMDDDQTVNVAKYLYGTMVKSETDMDMLAAVDFIIEALGKSEPAMTAEQKVDTIGKVYTILEDADYLTDYAELTIVEEVYAILAPHMNDEQAVKIAKFVYGVISDGKALSDEEKEATADYIIEVLGENKDLTDAARVEMIGKVYSLLKAKGYMDDYAGDLAMIEDVNAYLQANDLITDAQGVEIVEYMYDAIIKGDGLDGMAFLEFAYNVLVTDSELPSAGKVKVIGKLYAAVKDEGYLAEYADKLVVVEEIYAFLDENDFITDAQSLAIVTYAYNALKSEDGLDARALILYVYRVLFAESSAAPAAMSSSSSSGGLNVKQKLAAIGGIYNILKDNDYLGEMADLAGAGEELYAYLDSNKFITDEQAFEIFDKLFVTVLEAEEITDEIKNDLTKEIYTKLVSENPNLTDAQRIEVINKLYGILEDNGVAGADTSVNVPALPVIEDLYAFLIANKYMTEEQAMKIVNEAFAKLMDDDGLTEDDIIALAKLVYDELSSNEDLTVVDVLAMVKAVYETLVKHGYVEEVTLETIYAYLVDKGLEDAIEELKAVLEQKAKAYKDETVPMLKAAVAELDAEIAELNEELMALKAELEKKLAELDAAVGSADAAAQATIAQLKATIAELEASIKTIEEDILSLRETIADLEAAIEDVEAEIVALIETVEELEKAVRNVNAAVEAVARVAVDGAMTTVESAIEIAMETVDLALVVYERGEKLVEETVSIALLAYEKGLAIGKAILLDAVMAYYSIPEAFREELEATASAELKKLLVQMNEEIEKRYNEYAPEIYAEIARLNDELEAAHDDYVPVILAEIDRLNGELEKLHDEIVAAVIEEFKAQIEALQEAILAQIEKQINTAIEDLEDLQAQIKYQLEVANAALKEAYINATTDSYRPDAGSLYVAIGDASAAGESYVDIVAERLDLEDAQVENLADEEILTVAEAVEIIKENIDTIAKADLITVGFTSNSFMNAAINQAAGYGKEIDWAGKIGEEAAGVVAEAIELIQEELVKEIKDEATAKMLCDAVEAYAYSCIAYATELPEMINDIREVNEDAVVVIVGMYNPLENQVLEMNGQSIEIGKYMDYLTKAAGVHGLAYAMLTSNGIFVAAPDVETVYEAENGDANLDVMGLINEYLRNWGENFLPSEDGHVYIADQILNAIWDKAIWGDADGNGIVNAKDAMLVLQYYVKKIDATKLNTSVCDVDGNGAINAKDAMLILQKYVKKIEYFPVEVA